MHLHHSNPHKNKDRCWTIEPLPLPHGGVVDAGNAAHRDIAKHYVDQFLRTVAKQLGIEQRLLLDDSPLNDTERRGDPHQRPPEIVVKQFKNVSKQKAR